MIYATRDPAANGRVRELAQFVARDFVSISLVYRRTTAARVSSWIAFTRSNRSRRTFSIQARKGR